MVGKIFVLIMAACALAACESQSGAVMGTAGGKVSNVLSNVANTMT